MKKKKRANIGDKQPYYEKVKELDQRLLSNSELIDRSMLSLPTIVIAITMALTKSEEQPCLIRVGLYLLTGAIVITVISFIVSNQRLKSEINWYYRTWEEGQSDDKEGDTLNNDLVTRLITFLQYASLCLFTAGIIAIVLSVK